MNGDSIFELRVYTVKPDKLPDLLAIWREKGQRIIDRYFRCVGIWTNEFGEINQVYHIYAWKSLEQRRQVRESFYKDPEAGEYVKIVKQFYDRQESTILNSVDFFPTKFSN